MLNRYPQEASLRDGRRVLIRPFTENDIDGLHEFFQRLPEDSRRFAWARIDDRGLVQQWGMNLDYARVFPLLAVDGGKIVADATLHRRDHGPLRRVGRVKWLIDEEYRSAGLGMLLINHFIDIGRANGLRHLTCFLITDLEAEAITTLTELGFTSHTIPGYGTDPDGGQHDMTKLIFEL
ncbi:MAG: GNAT family N-acetyltransferase [Acidobacteriota bacterium]|nr:GNAT family N-acetyltransferase [Acidobacteriota bacterium]